VTIELLREGLRAKMRKLALSALLRWCPHIPHPKQLELVLAAEDEVLFGGAAGGGKSDALLMRLLRYVDVPGYSGIIFRRTHTDLALAGSLMDRAAQWFAGTGARWNDRDKHWTFPTVAGAPAKITFAYLDNDNDRFRYKSAEFQQVAWDELTQFPSDVGYRFLWSRLRGVKGTTADIPLQACAATNPGDAGHAWVKDRFGLDDAGMQPDEWTWRDGDVEERVSRTERRFIRSLLEDNPSLDAEQYERSLDKLDSITHAQQRRGLWLIDGSQRVFKFDRERNGIAALPERDDWMYALSVDIGSSDSSPTTAFARIAWNPHERIVYVAKCWKEPGLDDDDIADRVEEESTTLRERWQGGVMDVGGLGMTYLKEARRRAGLAMEKAEKSDKSGFRKLLNGDLEKGLVLVVLPECEPLVRELETLVWNDQRTDVRAGLADHAADALLYGWRKAYAFASRAPDQQPAPGSREALDAEAKRAREREKALHRERQLRAVGEDW
jgi:hypothetical protein